MPFALEGGASAALGAGLLGCDEVHFFFFRVGRQVVFLIFTLIPMAGLLSKLNLCGEERTSLSSTSQTQVS